MIKQILSLVVLFAYSRCHMFRPSVTGCRNQRLQAT
jgi:hypothetical protein